MKSSPTIAAVMAIGMLAACAPTDTTPADNDVAEAPDPRRGEEVKKVCFSSQIDSFGETTRRTVVVRKSIKERYLIETYSCFNLDHAQGLSFDTFSSCISKGDYLFAFDSPFVSGSDKSFKNRCAIKAIYKWDPDAEVEEAEDATEDSQEDTSETSA